MINLMALELEPIRQMENSAPLKTVNFSDKLSLTNGRLITKNDGDKNLVGIYTNNKKYELSNGFFISNLNETSKNKITYYNYSELENFFKSFA